MLTSLGARWGARRHPARLLAAVAALLFVLAGAGLMADQTAGTLRVSLSGRAAVDASLQVTSDREPSRRWSAVLARGHGATVTGLPPAMYHVTVIPALGGTRATIVVAVTAGEIVSLAVGIGSGGSTDWRLAVVDRSRTSQGMHFDGPALRDVPTGSGLPGLLDATAPFLIGDRLDTGGLGLGNSERVGSRGASWTRASVRIDGVRVPDGPVPVDRLALVPDLDAFDAVVVGFGGATPDIDTPGPTIVLVPRRPGPERRGAFDVSFTTSGMVSTTRAAAPSIEQLDSWKSAGLQYGGPVGAHTGLFVSGTAFGMRERDRDRPAVLSSSVGVGQAHFISDRSPRTQVRLLARAERVKRPYAPLQFVNTTLAERDLFLHVEASAEHQTAPGARAQLKAAFERAGMTPDAGLPSAVVMDWVVDGIVPGTINDDRATRSEVRVELASSEMHGHVVEGGLTLARATSSSHVLAAPTIAELVAGVPARVWIPALPLVDSHRAATHFALYVNDRIRARSNLTADLGLRLQVSRGSAGADASRFPWRAALPRASVRWAPRLLTVFGGYGRYQEELPLSLLAFGDPGEPVTSVYRWSDVDGNGSFDPGEAGPLVALAGRGPAVASADTALKSPHTDEVTFGAERRLGARLVVSVTGSIRRERSILRSVNVGIPLASYATVYILDQGQDYEGAADDRLLAIYDRAPASFGQDRYQLTNAPDDSAKYEGLEIAWAWNGVRWWTTGGASALRTEAAGGNRGFRSDENDQGVIGEVFEDPNAATNARGRLFFDRGYALKLAAGFRAPHDVRAAVTARYEDGQPFARLVVAPDLAQGPEIVQAYPNGRTRFMFVATVDARVEKWFNVGRRRAALRLEVFNLTNVDNEVEENPLTGIDFRRTTAVQPPRAVRVGFHVEF